MSATSLSQLLAGLVEIPAALDRTITGLAMDSRRVQPGELFLACAGSRGHGMAHIEDAVHRGAVAVALDAEFEGLRADAVDMGERSIPVLPVTELRARAGLLAARFYGDPSAQLKVVGVTGTNGKTSVTWFIAGALAEQAPCGVIGTLGSGLAGRLEATGHTTPDAASVQATLAGFRDAGAPWAAMEVSSHGLHQGRVNGVRFGVAVFTNLSHEHLDYHGDMAAYAEVKRGLFELPGVQAAVINVDDPVGRSWLDGLPATVRPLGYGFDLAHRPSLLGRDLCLDAEGLHFSVQTPEGEASIASPLLGRFNASNLLAALGALLALGLPLAEAARRLGRVPAVPGRMERFGGGARPLALVDYAHTPDALEQVLEAARAHCRGRLWCVFGCGGNRDRAKRPLMGKVAERLADEVVLTDDNPRHEDPDFIIQEIRRGMSRPAQAIRERAAAIHHALASASAGDVVVIAGKGHETEQQIGDTRLPFSDRAEVARFFGEEISHG